VTGMERRRIVSERLLDEVHVKTSHPRVHTCRHRFQVLPRKAGTVAGNFVQRYGNLADPGVCILRGSDGR
jgi:hypothetical protein